MHADLGNPIPVPFEKLYLDPNNPRIGPSNPPGYQDASKITDKDIQHKLGSRVRESYRDAASLEAAIIALGWVPIDPIIVWQIPTDNEAYVVVEGNTRTTVLRNIRQRLVSEKEKLVRLEGKKTGLSKADIDRQRKLITDLDQIVKETEQLRVVPVLAATPAELEEKLPRVMGVRHITHVQNWSPYATNLYILSLYHRAFEKRYGAATELRLDDALVTEIAAKVSNTPLETRRNIQAASAFSHFQAEFEDKLPEGKFTDSDQYFFDQILKSKHAQTEFEFGKDKLHLPIEKEKVLFQWAFSKPRPKSNNESNENVLRIAEDIRLWQQMKTYDSKQGTNFAAQLDVEEPEHALPMDQLEVDFLESKQRSSPVATMDKLLKQFKDIKVDTLRSQADFLRPTLEQIRDQAIDLLKVIDTVRH